MSHKCGENIHHLIQPSEKNYEKSLNMWLNDFQTQRKLLHRVIDMGEEGADNKHNTAATVACTCIVLQRNGIRQLLEDMHSCDHMFIILVSWF